MAKVHRFRPYRVGEVLPFRPYRVKMLPSPYPHVPGRESHSLMASPGSSGGDSDSALSLPSGWRRPAAAAVTLHYHSQMASSGSSGGGGSKADTIKHKPGRLAPATNKREFNGLAFIALRRRRNAPDTIAEDDWVRHCLSRCRQKVYTYPLNQQQFLKFQKHANRFLIGDVYSRRDVIRRYL